MKKNQVRLSIAPNSHLPQLTDRRSKENQCRLPVPTAKDLRCKDDKDNITHFGGRSDIFSFDVIQCSHCIALQTEYVALYSFQPSNFYWKHTQEPYVHVYPVLDFYHCCLYSLNSMRADHSCVSVTISARHVISLQSQWRRSASQLDK